MKPSKKQIKNAIALIVLLLVARYYEVQESTGGYGSQAPIPAQQSGVKKGSLNFIDKDIVFTKHASCRMGCRGISRDEVLEVLANGKINRRKSNPKDKPCPSYSVEKRTLEDRQLVRVVVGSCAKQTTIISTIDLENEYKCSC